MLFEGKFKKMVDSSKAESDFAETLRNVELEKNDTRAMIIAAFLIFTPAILATFGLFYAVIWLIYFR